MKRAAFSPLISLIAVAAFASCTTSSGEDPRTDSQTHWLSTCETDADCSAGLTCLCDICTRPCDAAASCGALSGDAICAEATSGGYAFQCASAGVPAPSSAGICLAGCGNDLDCEAGFICEGGACIGAASCADPIDSEGDAAPCEPGFRFGVVADAAGCPVRQCVPIEGCAGDPAPVVCGEGEHVVEGVDANGCPTQTCEPDRTDCPPIAAPDASFCASGERVEAVTGEDGCPSWSCTSEGCLPVDPAPEVCFNGQPPRRQLDASGCAVDFCDPERSFPCGPGPACSIDTEYCARSLSDVVGEDDHYACQTFPEQCLGVASCECLLDALQIDPAEQVMCEDGGGPGAASSITLTFPGG